MNIPKEATWNEWKERLEDAGVRIDRLRQLGAFSGIMYYEYDVTTRRYISLENTKPVLGYEAEELEALILGSIRQGDGYGLTHPEDKAVILTAHEKLLHDGESKAEYRFRCKSGAYHWFCVCRKFIYGEDGKMKASLGMIWNIDQAHTAISQLSTQVQLDPMTGLLNKVTAQAMIKEKLENDPNGKHALLFFDMDKFKEINDTYGHNEGDEAIKCVAETIRNLFRKRDIVARFGGDEFVAFLCNIASEQDIIRRVRGFNKILQESRWARQKNVKLSVSIGIAFSEQDIGVKELFSRADQAVYAAKKDPVTRFGVYNMEGDKAETPLRFGLPDRYVYFDQVDSLLSNLSGQYCFVVMDIEHFNLFNKWYGRETGDALLSELAEFVKSLAEIHQCYPGYLGGDNLAVLLPDQEAILKNLEAGCCEIVMRYGKNVGFLPAFGIYRIEEKKVPAVVMCDCAMVALSHVIGNYFRRSCVYSTSMTDTMEEELILMDQVREGISKKQMTFYVQPKVNINSHKIIGAEVLARWNHPTKGVLSPGSFVPQLEKNGIIGELDKYIWEEACRTYGEWIAQGHRPIPVSINVSSLDLLSMDVAGVLKELTDRYGVDRRWFRIEITENSHAEVEQLREMVQRLKDMDFIIFMDDFGSGSSSLKLLKSPFVDVLKIDMKLLEMEQPEEKGARILEHVIGMAHSIGLPVIVEGVENQWQEEYLKQMNCEFAQGYYYYKPMPLEAFLELVEDPEHVDYDGIIGRWQKTHPHKG